MTLVNLRAEGKLPEKKERLIKSDKVLEYPKISIKRKKPVVNLGRMEGQGPESGVVGQKKRSDYVQRAKDAAAANAMRAFRSNNAYRGNMMTTPDSILRGMPESALMAKKGGRIVKGKKTAVRTGAAKRGFGRAFKGGK